MGGTVRSEVCNLLSTTAHTAAAMSAMRCNSSPSQAFLIARCHSVPSRSACAPARPGLRLAGFMPPHQRARVLEKHMLRHVAEHHFHWSRESSGGQSHLLAHRSPPSHRHSWLPMHPLSARVGPQPSFFVPTTFFCNLCSGVFFHVCLGSHMRAFRSKVVGHAQACVRSQSCLGIRLPVSAIGSTLQAADSCCWASLPRSCCHAGP